jgi:hypothetical protein
MSRKVVMQRNPDEIGLFSLATFQTMRLEALDLFDRCLAESKPEHLERFLEQQVAQDPPPLELLSQIAEDVHQRLLTLRQQHFDARDHFRRTLQHQYGFDVSPFFPADPLEYHRLNLDEALRFIGDRNPDIRPMVRQLLQDALANATRLYVEMTLAEHLYTYVMDWLMALHIVSVRGAWADDLSDVSGSPIH